jgi:carbonic anhydrase
MPSNVTSHALVKNSTARVSAVGSIFKALHTPHTRRMATPSPRAVTWGYGGNNGPLQWAALGYQGCGKRSTVSEMQAPIDVESATVSHMPTSPIPLYFRYFKTKSGPAGPKLTRNSHGLFIFNGLENSAVLFQNRRFSLRKISFHTPSENHIDGKKFPLEAQLQHTSKDGKLLIVSVLYKIGHSTNPALSRTLGRAKTATSSGKFLPPFDAAQLLPQFKSFFLFRGSMTTPPCTGGVIWVLMQHPSTISASMVMPLHLSNIRPIQPIGMRQIEYYHEPLDPYKLQKPTPLPVAEPNGDVKVYDGGTSPPHSHVESKIGDVIYSQDGITVSTGDR